MSDNKRPSYPWYPKDFATDEPVQLMSLAQEGAYRRLLDHQWLHGSIPGDVAQLAAICKNITTKEMKKIWAAVEPLFSRMPGQPPRLRNDKLERVREQKNAYLAQRREAGSRGGKEASRRRHEKPDEVAEGSDRCSTATPPLPAESNLAFASAIASSVTASVPTEPALAVDSHTPDHTHRSCLGLVVEKLYSGNRPPEAAMRNEASIARRLGERHGYGKLARAIEGLARRRDSGEFPNIKPRQVMSLKWLNSDKFDINQLAASEDAYYRDAPSRGSGGVRDLAAIIGAIGKGA